MQGGIYFNIRSDDAKPCILVIIGVTEQGRREFIAIEDGYRESEQNWSELLLRIKAQGMRDAPQLAIGGGALGFLNALSKVFPKTVHQRCWVHKTANVHNKLPKVTQPKANRHCMKSGWHRSRRMPTRPLTLLSPRILQNFQRQWRSGERQRWDVGFLWFSSSALATYTNIKPY